MRDSEDSKSVEANRRRQSAGGEEGRSSAPLADGIGSREEREFDQRLNELLRRLPEAPISSNFTARVLRQAEQVARARKQHPWRVRWESLEDGLRSLGWASRLATGAAVVALVLLCSIHFRAAAREEMARSVVAVSNVAALPSWEVLVNFEAIQRLPEVPEARAVDVELLAALR